jgi:CBS domain containing-hemolysin-like protein/mannitol/fructose-specific phosphotransferase system IIA component (Ntr-type)
MEAPMDWMTPVYVFLALVFVLLNGFFVLAEFALVKVRATRIDELAKQGNGRALVAREMVLNLDSYLAATQLGITLASLGLGWIGEPAFAGVVEAVIGLPGWWSPAVSHSASIAVAFLVITFLHILLGELAPKSLAIRRSEHSTLAIAYPMLWAYRLFYLPMVVLNGASNLILRLVGLEVSHPDVAHTEHELRILLSTAQTTSGFSLNRLLMLENIFDLGHQTVKEAMIPWSRVLYLSRPDSREQVTKMLAEHRYSRWPVLTPATGLPTGYLLMRDLVAQETSDADWTRLVRPVRSIGPRDNLEAVMQQLQKDGANMAVVVENGRPVGLITLEDILEEIVGRMEDEYPRVPRLFLKEALTAGGVILHLPPDTPENTIRAMTALIPAQSLTSGVDVCALALSRERQAVTDVGHGVAIPHARCNGLARPVLVFGRSAEGILFGEGSPAHLIFLLVTPSERPSVQVFLLEQLASVARRGDVRERLMRAATQQEAFDIIAAADPAATE